MQYDKLTLKSQEALQDAQNIARSQSHQEMDCEHLLLALTRQPESLVPALLPRLGADPTPSRDLQKALEAAQTEAAKLKDDYVSTEHLLLGLLDQPGISLKRILG